MGDNETLEERIAGWNREVAAFQRAGNVKEGVELADKAFFTALEELPEGHFLRAQSARNRGIMQQMSGNDTEAYTTLLLALDSYGKALKAGVERQQERESAGDLQGAKAAAAQRLELNQAIEQLRVVLFGPQANGAPKPMDSVGAAAHDLAKLHLQLGEYQSAKRALDEAESAALKAFGDRHANYAAVLQVRAKLERELGRPAVAVTLLERALEILRAFPSCPSVHIAGCLNNLGFTFQELGQFDEALRHFENARKLVRNGAEPLERKCYTTTLTNLAELYAEIGQDDRAEPLLREALDSARHIYGAADPALAASINNLGIYLLRHGEVEEGAKHVAEAREILEKSVGAFNRLYVAALFTGANALRAAGRFAESETQHVFALETLRKIQADDTPLGAETLSSLALTYARRGKFDQAEGALGVALRIFEATLPRDHHDTIEARFSLFIALAAQGKNAAAFEALRQAIASESVVMDIILRLGSEKDRLTYLSNLQWHVEAALSFVIQQRISDGEPVTWLFELLLRRCGLSAEVLAAQRDAILGSGNPKLAEKLARLNELKAEIGSILLRPATDSGAEQRRLALDEEKSRLERELARAIPEIRVQLRLNTLDGKAIQRVLGESTALLEFVRYANRNFAAVAARNEQLTGPDRYVAFVVKGGKPAAAPRLYDLGEATGIDEAVARFRAVLTGEGAAPRRTRAANRSLAEIMDALFPSSGRSRAEELAELGGRLEQALLAPLKSELYGVRRVVIVPDGALMRLPFECLPCDNTLCMDQWQVSYLSTSRELVSSAYSTAHPTTPSFVVAAPDYDLTARVAPKASGGMLGFLGLRAALDNFPPLKGTRAEGRAVAILLKVQPLLGAAATERRVKAMSSPRILHIATHGFYFDRKERPADRGAIQPISQRFSAVENPMVRSGLALAGANSFLQGKPLPEDAEDGILTAEDVTALDLRGTELVVLSACETGLGDVRSGEGLFGLRRAFSLAGAATLVVSLWSVADKESRELMEEFYSVLLRGKSAEAALQEAKNKMRERYKDPFYWGAFIALGPAVAGQKEN